MSFCWIGTEEVKTRAKAVVDRIDSKWNLMKEAEISKLISRKNHQYWWNKFFPKKEFTREMAIAHLKRPGRVEALGMSVFDEIEWHYQEQYLIAKHLFEAAENTKEDKMFISIDDLAKI